LGVKKYVNESIIMINFDAKTVTQSVKRRSKLKQGGLKGSVLFFITCNG